MTYLHLIELLGFTSRRLACPQAFRTGRERTQCLPLLLLGEADVRGRQSHRPAKEPGEADVDMVSLKRDLHPDDAELHPRYVHHRRQLEEPRTAGRPRHLPASDTEVQMSAAISTASDRCCLTKGAAFLDVPAGADREPWQPSSRG